MYPILILRTCQSSQHNQTVHVSRSSCSWFSLNRHTVHVVLGYMLYVLDLTSSARCEPVEEHCDAVSDPSTKYSAHHA